MKCDIDDLNCLDVINHRCSAGDWDDKYYDMQNRVENADFKLYPKGNTVYCNYDDTSMNLRRKSNIRGRIKHKLEHGLCITLDEIGLLKLYDPRSKLFNYIVID